MDQRGPNRPKWTKVDQNGLNGPMGQSGLQQTEQMEVNGNGLYGPKQTEVDHIGPNGPNGPSGPNLL